MIEARDLTKNYGRVQALRGVDFDIQPGEVVGLLGPNGAGKSTAMRITTGFLSPSSGTVTVDGSVVLDNRMAVQSLIGYLPEGNPLYPEMRLREALRFVAASRGLRGDDRKKAIGMALDDAGLLGREHQIVSSFSRGYRQRVGLAMALMGRPPILILDEPTSGLDPNQQLEMRRFLRSLAGDHTVVFSSHILPEVEAVCDRVIIVHQGEIVADGTIEDVCRKASGEPPLRATLRASEEQARSALGAVSVAELASVEPGEAPGLVDVALRPLVGERAAVREGVSQAVFAAGLGLSSMTDAPIDLESAFAALTPAAYGAGYDELGTDAPAMSAPPPAPDETAAEIEANDSRKEDGDVA